MNEAPLNNIEKDVREDANILTHKKDGNIQSTNGTGGLFTKQEIYK